MPFFKSMKKKDHSSDQSSDLRLVYVMKLFSEATSIFIIFIGISVIISWQFNISFFTKTSPEFALMRPSCALGAVLLGVSLWLLQQKRSKKRMRNLGRACALVVFFLGIINVVEYALGANLFISELFFRWITGISLVAQPEKIALNIALIFIFFGLALLSLDAETKRGARPAQIFAIIGGFISLAAIIGHIHGVPAFYQGQAIHPAMSIYAAIVFFIFHFGVLLARPDRGFIRVLVVNSFAGRMARIFLPTMFIIPLVIGWAVEYGEHIGLYNLGFDVGLETFLNIAALSLVVVAGIGLLKKQEDEKIKSDIVLFKREGVYHKLVDKMSEGLGVQDKNQIITFMNRRGCEMLGYKLEELVGKPITVVFDKENQKILKEQMVKRRAGAEQSYEIAWLRKDGSKIVTIISPSPIFDEKGDFAGSVAVFIDITESKMAEEEIKKEQLKSMDLAKDLEKFKLAVDGASDHIMITDVDGTILYVNKAVENITGYSSEESLGKNAGKLWGGNMTKEFYENMWRIIKSDKKLYWGEIENLRKDSKIYTSGEVENRRKNGEIYTAELRISPILNTDGSVKFFVGIERDITKFKETEQMQKDFISFTSHQLRTPLTVMNWNMEMLENTPVGKFTAEQKKYIAEIKRGEKRMANLINSLLNISRLESEKIKVEPKPLDITQLISDVISDVGFFAKARNCAIKFNKSDQPPPFVALDAVLLKQVLSNLLLNAVSYSKPKKCQVEVVLREADKNYQIDVIDEGIGIPAGIQSKIFTKFFRADNAVKADTEGTGLGLYMSKLILEMTGGKIWFESTENKGSVFHITIPKSGMIPVAGEKELSVVSLQ